MIFSQLSTTPTIKMYYSNTNIVLYTGFNSFILCVCSYPYITRI